MVSLVLAYANDSTLFWQVIYVFYKWKRRGRVGSKYLIIATPVVQLDEEAIDIKAATLVLEILCGHFF